MTPFILATKNTTTFHNTNSFTQKEEMFAQELNLSNIAPTFT